jgi:hypothetical protein
MPKLYAKRFLLQSTDFICVSSGPLSLQDVQGLVGGSDVSGLLGGGGS